MARPEEVPSVHTPPLEGSELLLDNEVESDVEFIVGPDGNTWRIPGHRDVLSHNSPVFKAMLTGPMAHDGQVRIEDIDGRAFYQLLRVLYGAPPEIRSEHTCLLTMYAANKYLCTQLFLHCVETADGFLRPANVLRVMQAIKFFIPADLDVETAYRPTAPPYEESFDAVATSPSVPLIPSRTAPSPSRRGSRWKGGPPPVDEKDFPDPSREGNMGWYSGALYWNCLQLVDAYVDDVFECECVEDLSHEDLLLLLRRSTLAARRESRLFSALVRWADRDCKRRGVKVSADNKRRALGEALYHVRYLQMATDELLSGPIRSGLLDPAETACILGHAIGKPKPPPDSLKAFIDLIASPRPPPRPCYIHLSARSMTCSKREQATMTDWCYPVNMSEAEVKKQVKALKQIAKLQKKEEKRMRRIEEGRSGEDKCSWRCFCQCFFSTLACILD